jgi:hypothetical protein
VVEVWFDREPEPPRRQVLQLPARGNARVLRLTALYLAALINNTLCVWGARRVSLGCRDEALARELLNRVTHLLYYEAEILTDLTPLFVYALIRQRYGRQLVLDADQGQVARLASRLSEPAATPTISPLRPGRHAVLAINIGQHKTSCGLVRLDGADGFAVSRLHRQPTWPDGQPRCYPALAEPVLRHLAGILGPLPPDVEAVCLSLATPVIAGKPHAVSQIGLTAACDQDTADTFGASLRAAVGKVFPGLPVSCINDACAQGLYTSRFGRQAADADQPDCATELLSIRLGACPSVSYIDAGGHNLPRINEFAWLVTRVHGPGHDTALLATISRALSFHGLGCLAHELGLLEKYRVAPDAAAVFFHELCARGSEAERRDALALYHVLGAHMAMLAYEVHRDTPVRRVRLLGSEANRIDPPVFAAIWSGFSNFIERNALPFAGLDFSLTEDASAQASLVGAAVGYADGNGIWDGRGGDDGERGEKPPAARRG